jgi:hypothetical protein
MNHPAQADDAKGMTDHCPYCADTVLGGVFYDMNCRECCRRGFGPPLTEAQVRDHDSLFGCLPEEKND